MDIALIIPFVIGALILFVSHGLKLKTKKRQVGFEREEFRIDAANVPEFKPTWRNAR